MSNPIFEKQTEKIENLAQNEYDINFLQDREEQIRALKGSLVEAEAKTIGLDSRHITQADIEKLIALNGARRSISETLENIGKELDLWSGTFFYFAQLEEAEIKKNEISNQRKIFQIESNDYLKLLEENRAKIQQSLKNLKAEILILKNIEKQKFSGAVNAAKRFFGIGGGITENYQNLEKIIKKIDNQSRADIFSDYFQVKDLIDLINSNAYSKLRQQANNQNAINIIFNTIQESQELCQRIKGKLSRNLNNQNQVSSSLKQQSEIVQRLAAEYIKQLKEAREKLGENMIFQNWLGKIEKRKRIVEFFDELGIDNKSEKIFLESIPPSDVNAVNLGRRRSFSNIRDSVRLFLEYKDADAEKFEIIIQSLKEEIDVIKDNLVISCNRKMPSAVNTLKTKRFKTIRDFGKDIQREKARDYKDPAGYLVIKNQTERKLGWSEGENIFSLAVDDPGDEISHNGSAWQYGSVRFVFDKEVFSSTMIFVESDSINPDGLPWALRHCRIKGGKARGKTRSPAERQIDIKHLPIAKAIFNISKKAGDFNKDSEDVYYIEAQTNIDPFQAISEGKTKEVVLDPDMMETERKESISYWIAGKARGSKSEEEAKKWRLLNMESDDKKRKIWKSMIIDEIRDLCAQYNARLQILNNITHKQI
ncbi:hypothetical protein COV49_04625 [Candidatus Falkowbacteria bacterium CG11_big_fil_rev_8_21_14_0_20_39_10]|uniref:Uncharacterized protein n=1 Tax=Candidatus Falkowbacteria bacterium CG11_big_fil_rev_8_21_14_0_20_39_10 TaxID=1974570 RepID=A0A2M6K7W2_9BACT|nr:MAG: hypothetical protein COV49_04625 [Candidatus Falkowbacteria bacterium CG11_big_fil_rev_8_21_14_0_20_39_10]